jgi:hypothetical protein
MRQNHILLTPENQRQNRLSWPLKKREENCSMALVGLFARISATVSVKAIP